MGQEGGLVYHAVNRANARLRIFGDAADYLAFEHALSQAIARDTMRLLAHCLMPNHFHLVLWPTADGDGDLSRFMRWPTMTHAPSAGPGQAWRSRPSRGTRITPR